jgi:hypothetical protein
MKRRSSITVILAMFAIGSVCVLSDKAQLLDTMPIEWFKGRGFCLAYVAGMRAIACTAGICLELFGA